MQAKIVLEYPFSVSDERFQSIRPDERILRLIISQWISVFVSEHGVAIAKC
jgi:hypothetical protein